MQKPNNNAIGTTRIMATPKSTISRALRERLEAAADPVKARAQQAYMKSEMPYAGVAMPAVRTIARETLGELRFDDATRWRATVQTIWRGATYREERYCAIALGGMPPNASLARWMRYRCSKR